MPDSTVQVNNSFGKIVLKSYDSEQDSGTDFNDTASYMNGISPSLDDEFTFNDPINNYQNNEYSFLNNNLYNNIDTSQVVGLKNKYNTNLNSNTNNYQPKYNSNNYDSLNNHRRSSSQSSNQRYHSANSSYNANSITAARNYVSSESTGRFGQAKAVNYQTENKTKLLNQETNDLPVSYQELKSISSSKLDDDNSQHNYDSNEESLVKPFVPGKVLIGNKSSSSISSNSSASVNQTNNQTNTSSNSQIKEIKVTHKNPSNRFNNNHNDNSSAHGYTSSSSNNSSSNSSKESTPFSSTPVVQINSVSMASVASSSASSFSSTSSQQQQQQASLQKSFKQQILNQGPKLVNF